MTTRTRIAPLAMAALIALSLAGPPAASAGAQQAETAEPAIAAAPAALDFGQQQVGTTSSAQIWAYLNAGAADVAVSATLTGTNAADFAIDAGATTCGAGPVAPGAWCDIGVVFPPAA